MRVPLVVVTGFLGAGKTTLVNRLLARRAARGVHRGGKLGVIVNELGEVGIDGSLLGGGTAQQVELPGGCVCCVLGDELGTTLLELIARTPGLEAIVLETTGVAEPLPIAWAVAREPVSAQVRLAAVVTLVDASNFLASRAVSASVDAQVAYADVLVMTKRSLLDDDGAASAVEDAVRELAPRALIRWGSTDDHAVWLEQLLADPSLPQATPDGNLHLPASPDGQVPHGHSGHVHTDDCRDDDSHAAHGIDSVWLPIDGPVDLEELEDQLADLPANYVRIKGIVEAERDGAVRWMVVHRVGPRVSSEPVAPASHALAPARDSAPGSEQARIVALGPSVRRAELARCVAAAQRQS